MLARRLERRVDEVELRPVVDRDDAARDAARGRGRARRRRASAATSSTSCRRRARARSVAVGSSPRGSLALLKLSRCRAALAGRDFVTPDDVKAVAVPALAHRLVLRPELWVQRRDGRGRRARAPRRGADADDRDDAGRRDPLRRRRGSRAYAALAAAGLVAALALRRAGARASSPRRSRCSSRSALARPRPTLRAWLDARPRAGARGRRARRDAHACAPRPASTGSSWASSLPPALEVAEGTNPVALRLGPGEERELPLRLRCVRWASRRGRRPPPAGARPDRARAVRGPHRPHAPAADLPDARAAPRRSSPRAHTQAATGSEVARVRARGARVRRHAAVRARRPAPVGQLARDRPPRQPRRQRAPSRAQRRRRRLPRQLRGGAGQHRGHARARRPASPRRSRAGSSSAATASASSPSAASCAGSSRRRPRSSSTGSSTRSSRPASSSATRGRTST